MTNSDTLNLSGTDVLVTVSYGPIDNTGTIALSGKTTLEIESGPSYLPETIGTITFLSQAESLVLDQYRQQYGFTGTPAGFSKGDVLHLSGSMYSFIEHVGNTLTVYQAALPCHRQLQPDWPGLHERDL